jgi:hypothetical protein
LTPLYKSIEVSKPAHILKLSELSPISVSTSTNASLLQKLRKKKKLIPNPYLILEDVQQEDQCRGNVQMLLRTLINRN